MKCRNPYLKAGQAFPCGQCMPCRFNKRREWSHRIMLEASCWSDNAWMTLTYNEECAPRLLSGVATLSPLDLKLFLKRLRRSYEPARFRFYAVGEYGEDTWRPHYHLAVFNFPTCSYGRTRKHMRKCCPSCEMVKVAWGKGGVDLGILSVESAQYTAGYVTKKMTKDTDVRLEGRHPEFSRQSNQNGGIGAAFMDEVASTLLSHDLDDLADVPSALRHGRRILPLGRYLRGRLRERIGRSKNAPASTLEQAAAEVRPLYESEWDNPSNSSVSFGERVKKGLTVVDDVRVLQMQKRAALRKKRSVL